MSRVTFSSPSGSVDVGGSERALFGRVVADLAVSAFHVLDQQGAPDPVRLVMTPDCGVQHHAGFEFGRAFATWLRVASDEGEFVVGDRRERPFSVVLNTAMAAGNDVLRLCARLHGQCEIHCWCEGRNRAWLAGLVRQGLEANIFRSHFVYHETGARYSSGWAELIAHLEARNDEPVVCSYSVCDGFPNLAVAGWEEGTGEGEWDDAWERWERLPPAERWRLAMIGLRREPLLELKPEGWAEYRFGGGHSAFDVRRAADDAWAAEAAARAAGRAP